MAELIWELRNDTIPMTPSETGTERVIRAEFATAVTGIVTPLVRYTHFECASWWESQQEWIDQSDHMIAEVTQGLAQDAEITVTLREQSYIDPNKYLVADAYIRYLILEGTFIDAGASAGFTKVLTVEDATSIANYGKRSLDLRSSLALPEDIALAMLNNALAYFKSPQPKVEMGIVGSSDALITQILTRHISDLITVQNTNLILDADFFIDKETHRIDQGDIHYVNYKLSKLIAGQQQAQASSSSKVDQCVVTY